MGEAVISSEDFDLNTHNQRKRRKETAEEEIEEEQRKESEMEKEGSKLVMRWENLFPKMALRVLLVEADDSTRQIIAALLRKCSYKGQLILFCFVPSVYFIQFRFFLWFVNW